MRKAIYKDFQETIEIVFDIISLITKKLLRKDAKVYAFGSYLKENFHPFLNDVNILTVSNKIKNLNDKVKFRYCLKKSLEIFFNFI